MRRLIRLLVLALALLPQVTRAQQPVVPCAQGQTNALGQTSCGITIAPIASTSSEASHIFKTVAGSFVNGTFVNATANAGFVMVLNATAVPTNGATVTPLLCAAVAANGNVTIPPSGTFFYPAAFSTGIVMVASASAGGCTTFTTASQPSGFFSAQVQ